MRYLFIITFLITILFLSVYYQFPSDVNERFAEEITADEEYAKALNSNELIDIPSNDLSNGVQNKFTKRTSMMNKLRDTLKTSHEMEEKTFELIKKKGINQNTALDSDIFNGTVYYEFKEGEYSGINKCYDECTGNCLEYGHTGHAWCFPNE